MMLRVEAKSKERSGRFILRPVHPQLRWLVAVSLTILASLGDQAADTVFTRVAAPFLGVNDGAMAWGDYDNDGWLDVIVTGNSGKNAKTVLYHNNGDGSFSRTGFVIADYRSSGVEWGDFDNDGFLDLVLTGLAASNPDQPFVSRVYRNMKGTNFVEVMRFGANYDGKLALGDFDNDGKLDFAVCGAESYDQIYRNHGEMRFDLIDAGLGLLYYGSVNWADFDGDGNLDLLLTGMAFSGGGWSYVYSNDGFGHFHLAWSLQFASEPGRWIDLDNDSRPDLALQSWSDQATYLYRNDGGGGFELGSTLPIGPMEVGDFNSDGWNDLLINNQLLQHSFTNGWKTVSTALADLGNSPLVNQAVCGDYDNDGRLDIILCDPDFKTELYRNVTSASNTPPSAPTGLLARASPSEVVLSWAASTDDQQTGGLTYNVRVGTQPGGFDIISPMSAPNGFRRVVRGGNAGTLTRYALRALRPGRVYYWSVQAVDNSFAGSPFGTEQSFVATAPSLEWVAGKVTSEIDRQTGLFYQQVTVKNVGPNPILGLRFSASPLSPDVRLISVSGTNLLTGVSFAEIALYLASGSTHTATLSYYSTLRQSPAGVVISVDPVSVEAPEAIPGTTLGIRLAGVRSDGTMAVECDTLKGRRYAIEYSDDLNRWQRALFVVVATGTRMVWVDTGPPVTDTPPSRGRFYRLVLLPI